MKLAGLYAYIAGENVVENDILDEIISVILFIIILLYAGKGDCEDRSIFSC